jgi:3-phenylpropionate/cinnamic acid dioxygenase small subunit
MSEDRIGAVVSDQVFVEVQRFLNREGALLDRREYRAWFALTTEDVSYVVKAQVSREAPAGGLYFALIDENAVSLRARVDQISNPKLTHAENPPSLTRRFISSLEAWEGENADQIVARSNILVYRNRPGSDEGFYVGERRDVLRKGDSGLRLARREVLLDQVMLQGPVSTLF